MIKEAILRIEQPLGGISGPLGTGVTSVAGRDGDVVLSIPDIQGLQSALSTQGLINTVYTTGNQSISGIKNFSSRPTVNGTGVLLSGDGIEIIFSDNVPAITNGIKTWINTNDMTSFDAINGVWVERPTDQKQDAVVYLSGLNRAHNGSPISATAGSYPSVINFDFKYSGLNAPPSETGAYNVTATALDFKYKGSTTGLLNISPYVYEYQELSSPRPLRIHKVNVNLSSNKVEFKNYFVQPVASPNGGEAELIHPSDLAFSGGFSVGINSCLWATLPDGTANIGGLCQSGANQISPPTGVYYSFVINNSGSGTIAQMSTSVSYPVLLGVGGFGGLVTGGIIVSPLDNTTLAPRTAIGLDRAEKELVMMVIDGRQPGISEGVTQRELANMFAANGCFTAMNLDGGGSSVIIIDNQIKNIPSDVAQGFGIRKIPNMLGFKVI